MSEKSGDIRSSKTGSPDTWIPGRPKSIRLKLSQIDIANKLNAAPNANAEILDALEKHFFPQDEQPLISEAVVVQIAEEVTARVIKVLEDKIIPVLSTANVVAPAVEKAFNSSAAAKPALTGALSGGDPLLQATAVKHEAQDDGTGETEEDDVSLEALDALLAL